MFQLPSVGGAGGGRKKITGLDVLFFPVKCNKKENFTLELLSVLFLFQIKYSIFYTLKTLKQFV